ncbi:MAG: hypothetical protein E7645_04470 [Ruminococcaceae bacterium]|nr:hypothetical protein [Oscillospiraceae bacterium]
MNEKGMELMTAMDGISDDMLADALPPGMGAYEKKHKLRRLSDFFDRPWVAAVISASVALMVLSGVLWVGQQAAKGPNEPAEGIAGQPIQTEINENTYPSESDRWPDYDNPPVPADANVVISSGGYVIAPTEYVQWKNTWNPDSHRFEEERGPEQWFAYLEEVDSGADPYDRQDIFRSLPRIPYRANSFSVAINHPSLQFLSVSAYNDDLRHAFSASLDENFDSAWTLKDVLQELQPGAYCILLIAYDKGLYVEEGGGYEDTMYEFLFRVDILESDETTIFPDEPPVEPLVESDILGLEFWVGDSNSTYELLSPCVTYAYLYDEAKDAWADMGGYDAHYALEKGILTVPTLTYAYAPGFKAFFKTVSQPVGEGYLLGMTVYNEQLMKIDRYHDIVPDDLYQLSDLKPGIYYIIFDTDLLRPMKEGAEKARVEYAFRLVVSNENGTPSTPPVNNDPDVWGATIITGNREIRPVGQNEWTLETLNAARKAGLLPEAYDKLCVPQFSESGCYIVRISLFKVKGETLSRMYDYMATDLNSLQERESGDWCVVYHVQRGDPNEEGSMLLRSYAFMLSIYDAASPGIPDTPLDEATHNAS